MDERESYWSYKSPPTPDLTDLPAKVIDANEGQWLSLSPGMRREIWRDAIRREAVGRGLPDDILFRLRAATVSGSLSTLDEYLLFFEGEDAKRTVSADSQRLARADAMHAKSEVQIEARESI